MPARLTPVLTLFLALSAITFWITQSEARTNHFGSQAANPAVSAGLIPAFPSSTIAQVRVLSWNIQFGQGTDGIINFDRIATWIVNVNADIVALCEMPPDNISLLTSLLVQKTGRSWNSHFVPKYPGCPEGNLILSKYSFLSTGSRFLSHDRSVAQATINVGGRNVNFFATHFDHTSSALREVQAGEAANWTSQFPTPRILAGDLNAGPGTPEVNRLEQSYRDSWTDSINLGTASAYPDNPVGLYTRTRRWRIDFVLYSAEPTTLVTQRSLIPDSRDLNNRNVVITLGTLDDLGVRPSDHNPVIADFSVLGTGDPTPTPTPTPTPAPILAPVLCTKENTNRAAAVHSVLFTSEPFSLATVMNFGSSQRTRVTLFARNVEFLPGETLSAVSVQAIDSRGIVYQLPVEFVGGVANLTGLSMVVVRLPDDFTIRGDLSLNLRMHGGTSNTVFLGIRAP